MNLFKGYESVLADAVRQGEGVSNWFWYKYYINEEIRTSLEGMVLGYWRVSAVHALEVRVFFELTLSKSRLAEKDFGSWANGRVIFDVIVLICCFYVNVRLRKCVEAFFWKLISPFFKSLLLTTLLLQSFPFFLLALTWFWGFWYWSL